MSKTYIPKALRAKARKQANGRCSYCRTSEEITGTALEVDHILPEASDENNLCLSCSACNDYKNARTSGFDALSGEQVALFHPKHQKWNEHFKWSGDGTQIIGLTPTGRVTVELLKLNHPLLVGARAIWVRFDLHPPTD